MTIDDLVHDSETEAAVLRSVSHMTPERAQEFLLAVVLKIRRAQAPRVDLVVAPRSVAVEEPVSVQLPRVLASVAVRVNRRGRTGLIVEYLERVGSATAREVARAIQSLDIAKVSATLGVLVERGELEKSRREDDGVMVYRLAGGMMAAGQ